jgi:NADPH:quinone reductase
MRAIIPDSDGPVLQNVPRLSPGPVEVPVRVRANSLNRSHRMILKGASHGGLGGSRLPLGLEWAGE